MGYDVIVVGAGSAGCVAAAGLSRDDRCRVLLLEAGPDHPTVDDLPPDVADASEPTLAHGWGFHTEPAELGRAVELPRGRLVGGCSAINGAFLFRGWPEDYDGWAAAGNPGWSYRDLLPLFRAVEADADFADEWHGTSGPVRVERIPLRELSPVHRAFVEAATEAGHPPVADHNRPGEIGVGPMPRNVRGGLRMSSALTHLAPARGRANLTVRADAAVDRVEVALGRVTGVRLASGEVIAGDRVVLAAGAYCSPAVLLRSGVGPAADLSPYGIATQADLPGVGANLIDHAIVAVDLAVRGGGTTPRFQTMLTMRSSRAGAAGPPDLHIFPAGPWDGPAGSGMLGLVTGLVGGIRSRGSVRLRSADPSAAPLIDLGLLRDPGDLDRMVEATVEARRISRTGPLAEYVIGPELAPGPEIADDDRAGLAQSILARVGSYHHPVGTCAMGPDPDRGAVVDATGAVFGVTGLSVADASVMPTIPAANTHLPTVVVAERIASLITRGAATIS